MRLPRDLSGEDLVKKLREFGYEPTRQTGSHIRVSRLTEEASHHVTIPRHRALRVGTLSAILREISAHLDMEPFGVGSKDIELSSTELMAEADSRSGGRRSPKTLRKQDGGGAWSMMPIRRSGTESKRAPEGASSRR